MRLRIAAGVGVGGVRGMDRLVWGDRSGLCGGSRVGGARGGGGSACRGMGIGLDGGSGASSARLAGDKKGPGPHDA